MALQALQQAARQALASINLKPDPIPPLSRPFRTPRAAVSHCLQAFRRSFDFHFNSDPKTMASRYSSFQEARTAYCAALPLLESPEGVRNFLACLSHGLLVDAIPAEKIGPLLHAVQIGLAAYGLPAERRAASAKVVEILPPLSRAPAPRRKLRTTSPPRPISTALSVAD